MFARLCRQAQIPAPMLLGRRLSPVEFRAQLEVAQEWTLMESLLVVIAERVDWLRWTMQVVHGDKHSKPPEPFRMPRPGEKPAEPKQMGAAAFVEALRSGGV